MTTITLSDLNNAVIAQTRGTDLDTPELQGQIMADVIRKMAAVNNVRTPKGAKSVQKPSTIKDPNAWKSGPVSDGQINRINRVLKRNGSKVVKTKADFANAGAASAYYKSIR